ncbi:MAG: alginate export family protein [Gammaproteobacteria bacterium]|nr:alginate export family protein [Pseudomonadales bacterium]MCP5346999.1 alginate export family protein [Pseudomonadales bacterium]
MNNLPSTPAIRLRISAFLFALISLSAQAAEGPFRINEALGLQSGFSLGLVHSSRFEHIVDNVRPGTSKNDHALIERTLLDMNYRHEGFTAELELADMRQQWMDHDNRISNAWINPLDVLQANVGYNFGDEGQTWVRVGRFTEDWGSRRLMARNRFRNAIGSWDGLVVHHRGDNGNQYRLMATQVVQRLPTDARSLLDNKRERDESSAAQRFYGVFASLPELFPALATEIYYYALREKDTRDIQTRNRRFDTTGVRLRSARNPGAFDFEMESILQFGKRRNSTSPTDQLDQDHLAYFQYLSVGYSFDIPSAVRLALEFDYASGDRDPFDNDSGRFDSLFGPTTFEFGVVGLYDPFSRSNLITPGLRLTADPTADLNLMVAYRHFWLAEKRDSWGRTGLQDVTGASGSYLGQHVEVRVRWDVVPGNIRIDTGAIYLDARNLSNKNTEYFYTGVVFTF